MSTEQIKCVFMGSDPIVLPSLNALLNDFPGKIKLEAVYTQPDRRVGRGKKLTPNVIKLWAIENNIPVYQPDKLDKEDVELFKNNNWDLCIVMAYGHIIRQELLDTPEYGFYNLHASLLPRLRGASPIETSLVIGDTETGVTLMKVVKALDAGPIVSIKSIPVSFSINAVELRQELGELCVPLLHESMPVITSENPLLHEQNNQNATYCRLIDKNDGYLDFSLSAQEILNHIRGFYPWPGASFKYNETLLKIGQAKVVEMPDTLQGKTPGTLIRAKDQIVIRCGVGAIQVLELQKPGGKMLPVKEFLNGFQMIEEFPLEFPERYPLTNKKYFKKR